MTGSEITVAGHFGEWLQGRLGAEGPVALITLPCPALTVRAFGAPGRVGSTIFPDTRLRDFLNRLGLPPDPLPGIACAMPPGAGAGASTASLVAVARWAGFNGPPEVLARACLATEGATDPLMWPEPDGLFWASREARVIGHMAPPPPCDILGGFWGAPVATDPADSGFADISDLAADWARAVAVSDLAFCARLATLSAERCGKVRGPADPMAGLARDLGALGCLRAHTGSARGLIFAPGMIPPHGPEALAEAGLSGVLRFRTGRAA